MLTNNPWAPALVFLLTWRGTMRWVNLALGSAYRKQELSLYLISYISSLFLAFLSLLLCNRLFPKFHLGKELKTLFVSPGRIRQTADGFALGTALFFLRHVLLLTPNQHAQIGAGMIPSLRLALVGLLLLTFLIALVEEATFRGVLFALFRRRYGPLVAWIVISLLFGLIHLINDSYDLLDALLIAIRGGMLYTAAFWWTRRLWLSLGLHWGQDFTGMFLFGDKEMGIIGLTHLAVVGNPIVFGIKFLLGYLFPIITSCLMVAMARRRDAREPWTLSIG